MNIETFNKINTIIRAVKKYDDNIIEGSLITYILKNIGKDFDYSDGLEYLKNLYSNEVIHFFEKYDFPLQIDFIIEFFEALLEKDKKVENGIVFTPKYISDFICEQITNTKNINTIDAGCGCGIFLISAAERISKLKKISLKETFERYIYGIDIINENVMRCKISIKLYLLLSGENCNNLKLNIIQKDSLKTNWCREFNVDNFENIIGNPPYVNTHELDDNTIEYLRNNFITTKGGMFNIFYAFIENSFNFISQTGNIGFIIPNNFLTIKSAKQLRNMISENNYLDTIIDFTDNMIFKPVRTYNCIIKLNKNTKSKYNYSVIKNTDDILEAIKSIKYSNADYSTLCDDGWNLVNDDTSENLKIIENQKIKIKNFIKVGIATLRDNVYFVNKDNKGYFKMVNNTRYDLESKYIKNLYKVSEIKDFEQIENYCRYIIFPYEYIKGIPVLIDENKFIENAPKTYEYLCSQKSELAKRSSEKNSKLSWFAYGRSQGLNNYGRKLLYPTFSGKPKFMMLEDKDALYCNGYAICENNDIDLEILQKILNSSIMDYYVSNTSYSIEGGYYCYQKKFIENFSIPSLSDKEIEFIKNTSGLALDDYLKKIYKLK